MMNCSKFCGKDFSKMIQGLWVMVPNALLPWSAIHASWRPVRFCRYISCGMTPSLDSMGLLPDTSNCGLRMRRECRERFPRHQLHGKSLVSDPGRHRGACVMHVPWCMWGSPARGSGKNVPGIPGACATRIFFTYLARLIVHGTLSGSIGLGR